MKSDLQKCFEKISWKDNRLIIKSEKVHTNFKSMVEKIADNIAQQKFGALIYVGNETVACIYIGAKKVSSKKFIEPTPPTWWGGKQLLNSAVVTPKIMEPV